MPGSGPCACAVITYNESVYRLQREYPEQVAKILHRIADNTSPTKARELGYDLSKMLAVNTVPAELAVIEWYSTHPTSLFDLTVSRRLP